jgi:hypothetical protein
MISCLYASLIVAVAILSESNLVLASLKLNIQPFQNLMNEEGTDSLHANMMWNIGKPNGYLAMVEPSASEPMKLIVDVGLEFGSPLLCELFDNPSIALLGFEAHPINFGLAYHNMHRFREAWRVNDRVLIVPLGAFMLSFRIM